MAFGEENDGFSRDFAVFGGYRCPGPLTAWIYLPNGRVLLQEGPLLETWTEQHDHFMIYHKYCPNIDPRDRTPEFIYEATTGGPTYSVGI